MNFHPRFDKPITPQKNQTSDGSSMVKRIRLISPSPSPTKTKTHSTTNPKDHTISPSHSISDILDTEVFISLITLGTIILIHRMSTTRRQIILQSRSNHRQKGEGHLDPKIINDGFCFILFLSHQY